MLARRIGRLGTATLRKVFAKYAENSAFETLAHTCAMSGAEIQVMLEYEIPVAFGVLTTDNVEQAIQRAGTKAGNKGAEAALSALEMINVLKNLGA